MNTSMQTTKIKPTWEVAAMQKSAVRMASEKIASRINFLDKHHHKQIDELEKAAAHLHSDMLMKVGIKTPIGLVKELADYEVNMLGSEASISGDDDSAVLFTEKSAVWLEVRQVNNFSPEQDEEMQEHYKSWMKHLGHRLGFKVHVEIGKDGNSSKVTFTHR